VNARAVRVGPVSFRFDPRVPALIGTALAVLALLAAWASTLGSFDLGLGDVVRVLAGGGTPEERFVVTGLRLPRILAAVLVGPLLALSGAIFQGLIRNPLVSPDVIGIQAGAACAAVWWIVSGGPSGLQPLAAFAGAAAAAAAVYLLSWRGRLAPARLVLVGIGVNSLLTAVTTLLVVRARIWEAARAMVWMTGSINNVDWDDVRALVLALLALLPLGTALMGGLRVLQLGDDRALSLGIPVERLRLALILVGCAASAAAVSVAGPVGFIALAVPHLARMLAGPMTAGVFALTGVMGGILLLGADMVAQHLLPVSLPVGVVTGVVGAPYFLYLLLRSQVRL